MLRRKNSFTFIILLSLLILLSLALDTSTSSSDAAVDFDPWLNGFPYRKAITISPATPSANYQVQVTVSFVSGKMNSDFSDIRFTSSDGATKLYHWRASYTVSSTATFWVAVATSGSSTIYMYYGNASASSASNGTNTFIFFDDGSPLTSWTNSGVTFDSSVGNPPPSFKAVGGTYAYENISLTTNEILEFDANVISGTTDLCNFFFLTNSSGSGQMFRLESRAGNSSGFAATTSWTSWSAPTGYGTVTAGTWHAVKIVITATSAAATIDGTSYGSYTFANNGGIVAVHGDGAIVTGGYFDNVRVRKYASPEPTATVGSEDSLVTIAGSATDWSWQVPAIGGKVRSGSATDWSWVTFQDDSTGVTVPRGSATDWQWGP